MLVPRLAPLRVAAPRMTCQGRSAQLFLEQRDRAAPGEIGRGLIVAGRRSVVVEGVLRAVVGEDLVFYAGLLQRLLIGRNALVDAIVVGRIVQQQVRLDLGGIAGGRLDAVVGRRSRHVGATGYGQS